MSRTLRVLILPGLLALSCLNLTVSRVMAEANVQQNILHSLAANGFSDAQVSLGLMYFMGRGVSKDYIKAVSLFQEAARQQNRNASFFLAVAYARGMGVIKDQALSVHWFRTGADQGYARAQLALATKYLKGQGAPRDRVVAARWMYRAAEQGLVDAELALAKMIAVGLGMPKNEFAAYVWAKIAELHGNKPQAKQAAELTAKLGRTLTSGKLTKADKLAAEWKPTLEISPPVSSKLVRDEDGISASLELAPGAAVVEWRFTRRSSATLNSISGSIDGRPLGVPMIEPYPQDGARTAMLFLVDVTGAHRQQQIERSFVSLDRMLSRTDSHDEVSVVTFGRSSHLLVLADDRMQKALQWLSKVPPTNEPANLGLALQTALDIPPLSQAQRRSIFVLTDGHSDDTLDVDALIKKAKFAKTSITFLILSDDRTPEISPLTKIAHSTGGEIVKNGQLIPFMEAPFDLLKSGGRVRFPLVDVRRNVWDPEPEVTIDINYNNKHLSLVSPVVDRVSSERDALFGILRSCQSQCSAEFKTKIESRIALITAEEKQFLAARNDGLKLNEYLKGCKACSFRVEAQEQLRDLRLRALYKDLDAAGSDRSALERLQAECGATCPSQLRSQIELRIHGRAN